jgi:hypothetical protein
MVYCDHETGTSPFDGHGGMYPTRHEAIDAARIVSRDGGVANVWREGRIVWS